MVVTVLPAIPESVVVLSPILVACGANIEAGSVASESKSGKCCPSFVVHLCYHLRPVSW